MGKCKHDYEIIERVDFKSPWERMDQANRSALMRVSPWLFIEKTVFIEKCRHCKHIEERVVINEVIK